MEIIVQIGVFFVICLLGQLLSSVLPIPIPGSIIAMILLFLLLLFKIIKPKHIQKKSDFLLGNMAFFFIPAGVGIIEQFDLIKNDIVPLLVICAISTVLTFAAASGTVRLVLRLQNKGRDKKDE